MTRRNPLDLHGLALRLAAGLVAAVLAGLVAVAGWAGYQHLRNPEAALDRAPGKVEVVRDSAYRGATSSGERRLYRDLTLATAGGGTVRITTSRPDPAPEGELPLAFVLGGLRTGREALRFIPRHGDNLLVAYEYPHVGGLPHGDPGPGDLPALRRGILRVPAQVRIALDFLREEDSVDPERTSLLGYSLGALFAPAVQRLAAKHGTPFRAVILAYGGADLARLLQANFRFGPAPVRWAAAWLVATAIRPLEPALHLPHLPGEFLIIHGAEDERIPEASVRRLIRLTPEPKQVIRLQGAHMGPGEDEVNEQVVRHSRQWLVREGYARLPESPAR